MLIHMIYFFIYRRADKITTKDLAGKKDNFGLIDVREANEVAEDGGATIERARNIPPGQLITKARQGGLDDLKGKTISTYCNGGYRGKLALRNLIIKALRLYPSMVAMQLGKRGKEE